jgi:hypothetical protein
MTRTWPVPRLPGTPYSSKSTFRQKRQSGLHPVVRRRIQVARDEVLAELAGIDADLDQLSARRIELLDQLEQMRDRLWPEAPDRRGRRPPALDVSPMPPVPAGARPAWGRGLRGVCLTILGRHGALRLEDLHGLLHRYGYAVDSRHPVKALADAMAYEVRHGRAVRVERGVYDLAAPGRQDGFRSSPDPCRGRGPLGDLLPWSPTPRDGRDGWDGEEADETGNDWSTVPVDPDERLHPDRWTPEPWPDPPPEADPASCASPAPAPAPASLENTSPPLPKPVGTDSTQIRSRRSETEGVGGGGDGSGAGGGGRGRPAGDGGFRQQGCGSVDSVRTDEGPPQLHRPTDPP